MGQGDLAGSFQLGGACLPASAFRSHQHADGFDAADGDVASLQALVCGPMLAICRSSASVPRSTEPN